VAHVRERLPGAGGGAALNGGGSAPGASAVAQAAPPRAAPRPRRVVVLGASNVTRGLPSLVQLARDAWGDPLEIFAAIGLGRSYGMTSRVLARTLPSILECALWRELEARPRVPTRALVTDVGNDIGYSAPVDEILGWVDDAVRRLQSLGAEVAITDLPRASLQRLSPARYVLFRSLFFPSCRLSLRAVLERAEEVARGLEAIAKGRGARFERTEPAWYGLDPVHVRRAHMRRAWCRTLLGTADDPAPGEARRLAPLRLWTAPPDRQRLFGLEQRRAQPSVRDGAGGSCLWFY
jgi:hypothetical protein